MRSVSPAEGSDASAFTVPNLGRHPHHQRVKLRVGPGRAATPSVAAGIRIPLTPSQWLPPRGSCRAATEGESVAVSRRQRGGPDRIPPTSQCGQRGSGSDSADHSMWSAGGRIGFRRPLNVVSGGPDRIPLTTQCGQRGPGSDSADHSMWSAGGDAAGRGGELAVSRSCAVVSPSVAARQLPLGGSDFRSHYRPLRGRTWRSAEVGPEHTFIDLEMLRPHH